MHTTNNRQCSWVGNKKMCLDEVSVKQYGDIVLDTYGGNISTEQKRTKMAR